LGHFSSLPHPHSLTLPPPLPSPLPSLPGRNYFALISNFVEERSSTLFKTKTDLFYFRHICCDVLLNKQQGASEETKIVMVSKEGKRNGLYTNTF
jgi:hypothetical protein